jgi:hypothetical protein
MRLAKGFLDAFKNFMETEPEKQISPTTKVEKRTPVDKLLGRSVVSKTDQEEKPEPDPILKGIAFVETNTVPEDQKYSFRKPSGSKSMGDDIGKYQVTEGELASYADVFLGREVSADEFAASPEIQEEYMSKKVKKLRGDGLSDKEIAAFHRAGLTGWGDPKVRAKKLSERQSYADAVIAAIGGDDQL